MQAVSFWASLVPFLASTALASYANTAPMLVSSSLVDQLQPQYMLSLHSVNEQFSSIDMCPMLLVKVEGLHNDDLDEELINKFGSNNMHVFSNNVVYPVQGTEINNLKCEGMVDIGMVQNEEKWLEVITKYSDNVSQVFKLQNDDQLLDRLEKLSILHADKNIIIQGLPGVNQKRLAEGQIDVESIENGIRDAFQDIEELIDENSSSKATVAAGNSLFDNYSFFTPGIWMGTLISLFLFFLVAQALSWLSSMQISYRAFEKPVDFQKKIN